MTLAFGSGSGSGSGSGCHARYAEIAPPSPPSERQVPNAAQTCIVIVPCALDSLSHPFSGRPDSAIRDTIRYGNCCRAGSVGVANAGSGHR